MLLAVDRLAGRVSEHNGVIDNHIPALDHFTRECPAAPEPEASPYERLSYDPEIGYEISRRHLSANDLVLA